MGKNLKGKELGKGLSQRKDGTYEARYTDNFGKRHSIYNKKLSVVRRKLNEEVYKQDHNIYSQQCNLTLNEWFDVWVDTYYKHTVKPNTYLWAITRYNRCVRQSYLGNMKLTDIKTIHIQQFVNSMSEEKNLKQRSISIYFSVLKIVFKKAADCEYIIIDPTIKVVLPKKDSTYKDALTHREQELFLEYAKNTKNNSYYNLFRFALLTGMRVGEITALTWDDIDMLNQTINVNKTAIMIKNSQKDFYRSQGCQVADDVAVAIVPPKTTKSNRLLPMSKTCYDLLLNMQSKRSQETNIVFYSLKHSYLILSNIDRCIDRVCKRINQDSGENIKHISAHTFRHTFATRCLELNMNIKTVQYILGHSTIDTTMDIYTHITNEQAKKEIQAIDTLNI